MLQCSTILHSEHNGIKVHVTVFNHIALRTQWNKGMCVTVFNHIALRTQSNEGTCYSVQPYCTQNTME